MTQKEFFCQCFDVIEHWVNGNRKHLREVTDKLYNEVTKPNWISVEDELPKKDGMYIFLQSGIIYTAMYYKSIGLHRDVTHWMQLPQAPTVAKNATVQRKEARNENS